MSIGPTFLKTLLTILLSVGALHARAECPLIEQLMSDTDHQEKASVDEEFRVWFDENPGPKFKIFADDFTDAPNPYGLTVSEYVGLRNYTGPDYLSINTALRTCDPDLQRLRLEIAEITSALKKLPDYTGVVYRSIQTPEGKTDADTQHLFDDHQKGALVSYPAFTSSAADQSAGSWYSGPVLLIIHSKHGKLIKDYANQQGEHEVLFNRASAFKVIDRTKERGANRLIITLSEL